MVEINQHTEPVRFETKEDGSMTMEGLIALCNLGGINWGAVDNIKDFEDIAYVGVRALDNILTSQEYPFEASRKHNEMYRPIGIGITGLAYWMAKHGVKYDTSYELLDEWADYWSYAIIKASVELAKERGTCGAYQNTKWSRGIMPVDIVPEATNEIVKHVIRPHWETLRPVLKEYGIRNATLLAAMPAECQSLDNEMMLADGTVKTLRELITSTGLDIDSIHEIGIPERFEVKPFDLYGDRRVYSVYYNGPKEVIEIEFEDGSSYKFTENHMLKVLDDNGLEVWKTISELKEGDDVISFENNSIKGI